jgi:hypothetical protein
MLFSSWLRNAKPSRTATRRPATFRPRLESLEGRDVPSTLFVTNTSDSWSVGDGSLRGEIAAAQSGDTIQFAIPNTDPGYNPTTGAFNITLIFSDTQSGQVIRSAGEIQITKNLTILGPGADRLTISGAGSRVFEIDGAATTVTLRGLSITGGNGRLSTYTLSGGGIGYGGGNSGTPGTASDGQGGAVWNGGVLTIDHCVLSQNSADLNQGYPFWNEGGAIYNAGTLTVSNSTLSKNAAGDGFDWQGYRGNGGAIYNVGTLSVASSTLSDNAAYGYGLYFSGIGGAIDNVGSLSMSGGSLSNNSAYSGGAVFNDYKKSAALTNVTLAGNTAYDGGAIFNDGTMTLSGVTVTGNTATDAGGGIYDAKDGHLTIQSKSKVTGNSAPVGANLDALGSVKISNDSTVG